MASRLALLFPGTSRPIGVQQFLSGVQRIFNVETHVPYQQYNAWITSMVGQLRSPTAVSHRGELNDSRYQAQDDGTPTKHFLVLITDARNFQHHTMRFPFTPILNIIPHIIFRQRVVHRLLPVVMLV